MSPSLLLILIVVGAYLAAHVAFEWLGRRFRIVSGAEYLLLGLLLGPYISGLVEGTVVGEFSPFMTLALGWIGAVVGTQFYFPTLLRLPPQAFRVAATEALISITVVSGACYVALHFGFGLTVRDATMASVALGAIGVASAPSGIAIASRLLGRRGPLIQQLEVSTAVDALIAVVVFWLLLSILHVAPQGISPGPTATEWAVIGLALGCVGGVLFHLFLGGEEDIDRLFIALGGAIILVSGAAAYLRISPLMPALLVGAILVNTSRTRDQIREVLTRVERPVYFILLIFAGAAWSPGDSLALLLLIPLFLLVRTVAKVGGARVAARVHEELPTLGLEWGRGLLGHGGLAIAIALNYLIFEGTAIPEAVFSVAVVSMLLTDFSSARMVESLVRSRRAWLSRQTRAKLAAGAVEGQDEDTGETPHGVEPETRRMPELRLADAVRDPGAHAEGAETGAASGEGGEPAAEEEGR